jgi:DNA-binding NarL/FixJ family response regulator
MNNSSLLIADDHLLVAEGVANLLRAEFRKVAVVSDGQDLLATVQSDPPDLAIIDIALPMCNGLDAAQEIRKMAPAVKMIMLTMHKEPGLIRQAFLAGASGYVLKESAGLELLKAAKTVLRGGTYLSQELPNPHQDQSHEFKVSEKPPAQEIRLTPRQKIVLQLLVEGKTNKEMAGLLHLSLKTIEFHKTRMMKSLGVKNTAELTQYALQHHLAIL